MPPIRSTGLPTIHPSFSKHRYSQDYPSFPLKLNVPIPTPVPARASLPTPPMSGTPPPDPPSDPQQLAGRRRKREGTPPSTTQEAPPSATTSLHISSSVEQTAQRHGDPSSAGRASEPTFMPPPLTMTWDQPAGYGSSGGITYTQYAATPPLTTRPQQVSPRATRKTKAHVASACVNCKRKHLRCDETRPCRRCVQSGKEDTCKDVEHKKRGRPPLKQEGLDSSTSRLVPGGISLPPLAASSSRGGPIPGLVPLLPTPRPARNLYQTTYAPASIAESSATAQGQFSSSHRPISFPSARPPLLNFPHGGVTGPSQYGYMAINRPGGMEPEGSQYPNPLFPRQPIQQQLLPTGTAGVYGPNPVQLPPILPAPPGTTIDPAMAQQQRHFQPQAPTYGQHPYPMPPTTQPARGDPEERDPKRPKMDIQRVLGPRQ